VSTSIGGGAEAALLVSDEDSPSCFFFCASLQHLEQKFPVAVLPKKPHPAEHNTVSGCEFAVVLVCSLIVFIIYLGFIEYFEFEKCCFCLFWAGFLFFERA
jgi:hypothetical protein